MAKSAKKTTKVTKTKTKKPAEVKTATKSTATKSASTARAKSAATSQVTALPEPTYEQIAARAYEIYAERAALGQPGTPDGDWHEAERRLRNGHA